MGGRVATLRRLRWFAVCWSVALLPLFVLLSLVAAAESQGERLVAVTGCACVVSYVWVLTWHSAVRIYHGGLVVTNGFTRHLISWAAIERVEIDYGLWIRLANGQPIESTQFGGSLLGELTGYRSYYKTVERLERARRQAQVVSTRDSEQYRTRVAVPWLALLVIFGSIITLTVLGSS